MSRAKWRKRRPTVYVDFETFSTGERVPLGDMAIAFSQPPGVPWHLYEFQAQTMAALYAATGVNDVVKLTGFRRGRAASPAFGLPYGGQQIARTPGEDIYKAVADKISKPVCMGVDLATKPDVQMATISARGGQVMFTAGGGILDINRLWINGQNANRAPEREVLAMAFTLLAEARGATVERRDSEATPGFSGKGIDLLISLNGVGAMVDIDNLHGGMFALIHWYNSECRARTFSPRFCVTTGGREPYRMHHKATSFPADWYSLAMFLDGGLLLAARGEAFD